LNVPENTQYLDGWIPALLTRAIPALLLGHDDYPVSCRHRSTDHHAAKNPLCGQQRVSSEAVGVGYVWWLAQLANLQYNLSADLQAIA
jgi:hypothetical protein